MPDVAGNAKQQRSKFGSQLALSRWPLLSVGYGFDPVHRALCELGAFGRTDVMSAVKGQKTTAQNVRFHLHNWGMTWIWVRAVKR